MTQISCPVSIVDRDVITLAHGSGGKQTSYLIDTIFLPAFQNDKLNPLHDGAVLDPLAGKIVLTTDSYVVQPLFFPGGDIGKLAVAGTLNDLAMCGAVPRYLSCAFILEEGISQDTLKRVVDSMKQEAEMNGVEIVTGDTKVIERQTGNNLLINTTGVGFFDLENPITPGRIQKGDAILVSGDIGRHGIAIMAEREGLKFSTPLLSDCCSLAPIVRSLLESGIDLHCLRDLTRGGLATAMVELAESSGMNFTVYEESIPVSQPVLGACEILGFDPMYVANEGRFAAFVPQEQKEKALAIIQKFSAGEKASLIGSVADAVSPPSAMLVNAFGIQRPLYKLTGDQLPRIC